MLPKKKTTLIFLILGLLFLILALIITIPDNPPGIILTFISSISFILAFSYNWSRPKSYLFLFLGSLIGFVIFVVLHNFLEYFGKGTFIENLSGFFFLTAIFLCPAGILVGIIGSIVSYNKS